MAKQFHADNDTLEQQAETRYVPEHEANADHGEAESLGYTSTTRDSPVLHYQT